MMSAFSALLLAVLIELSGLGCTSADNVPGLPGKVYLDERRKIQPNTIFPFLLEQIEEFRI